MKKPATRRTAALAAFLCITAVSAHLHAGTVWLTYGDGASRKLSTAARLAVSTHTHPRDVRGPTRDISVSGARCTVTITATNVPDSFKSAVRQAARLISDTWRSSVVVHVHLRMSHLGGADVLALSGGTPVASVRSPWKSAQTVSLGAARALRERVLYPAHADATLTLNTAARWSGSRLARVTARDIFASLFFARARSNNAASHRIDAFVRDAQGCAVSRNTHVNSMYFADENTIMRLQVPHRNAFALHSAELAINSGSLSEVERSGWRDSLVSRLGEMADIYLSSQNGARRICQQAISTTTVRTYFDCFKHARDPRCSCEIKPKAPHCTCNTRPHRRCNCGDYPGLQFCTKSPSPTPEPSVSASPPSHSPQPVYVHPPPHKIIGLPIWLFSLLLASAILGCLLLCGLRALHILVLHKKKTLVKVKPAPPTPIVNKCNCVVKVPPIDMPPIINKCNCVVQMDPIPPPVIINKCRCVVKCRHECKKTIVYKPSKCPPPPCPPRPCPPRPCPPPPSKRPPSVRPPPPSARPSTRPPSRKPPPPPPSSRPPPPSSRRPSTKAPCCNPKPYPKKPCFPAPPSTVMYEPPCPPSHGRSCKPRPCCAPAETTYSPPPTTYRPPPPAPHRKSSGKHTSRPERTRRSGPR